MENFEIVRKFETLKFKIYDNFGRPEGGKSFEKIRRPFLYKLYFWEIERRKWKF